MIVCKKCGYDNPDGATFCQNPSAEGRLPCGAYLPWEGERVGAPPEGDPGGAPSPGPSADASTVAAPPLAPEPRTAVVASLSPDELPADPGGESAFEVRVRNVGTIVDRFLLTAEGDAARWCVVDPPALSLLPDTDGVAGVRVRPPRSPRVAAGPVRFGLKVSSATVPSVSKVVEATVLVGAFIDLRTRVVPQTSRGARSATHRLTVENRGNVHVRLALEATDPDELLEFALEPPFVAVDPDEDGSVRIEVRARRPASGSSPHAHPFSVSLHSPEAADMTVSATFVQAAQVEATADRTDAGSGAPPAERAAAPAPLPAEEDVLVAKAPPRSAPAPPEAKRARRRLGYLATLVGALGGGILLGFLGALLGLALGGGSDEGGSLGEALGRLMGSLVLAGLLGSAGLWTGSVTGCWLALRMRGHRAPLGTALVLAVFLPLILALLSNAFADGGPAFVVGVIGAPLLSRGAVLLLRRG